MKKNYLKNKWIKSYAISIKNEMALTDAELRLYNIYLRTADWDNKHTETFGSVRITHEKLLEYLPRTTPHKRAWSEGKVSGVMNSLAKKGWIKIDADKRVFIANYWIYRHKSVQETEEYFQQIEQGAHVTNPNVHVTEKDAKKNREFIRENSDILLKKWRVNSQPDENRYNPKDP